MRSLSKTTRLMFIFDLIVLYLSTYIWADVFGYTLKAVIILCFLIITIGLIILYLKGNYKIREFNINIKNTYSFSGHFEGEGIK